MALKPVLKPLTTPKNMTFPSELRGPSSTIYLESKPKNNDLENQENTVTITPPPAYTEFLQTFSPIFASPKNSRVSFAKYMLDKPRPSPRSVPSSTTSSSFSKGSTPRHSPSKPPLSPLSPAVSCSVKECPTPRRLRIPPPYLYSPSTMTTTSATTIDDPRSALLCSPYSPAEWALRRFESPADQIEPSLCVRHIVTTTVTYKRAPQLEAPPPGKRRRNPDRR